MSIEMNENESDVTKNGNAAPVSPMVEKTVEVTAAATVSSEPIKKALEADFEVVEIIDKPAEKPKASLKDKLNESRTRLTAINTSFKTKVKNLFAKKDKKDAAQKPVAGRFTPRVKGLAVLGSFVILIAVASFLPAITTEPEPANGTRAYWVTDNAIGVAVYHGRVDCEYLKAAVNGGYPMVDTSHVPASNGKVTLSINGDKRSASPCSCVTK